MTNYNSITTTELNTSSFAEIDRNAGFVFSYSDIEPEPVENGIRIFAEADRNTLLQLAETALNGFDYKQGDNTLHIAEQVTVDCKQGKDYAYSYEVAVYLGDTPEEVISNIETDNGNGVPLGFDEKEQVEAFAIEYSENVLGRAIDEVIAEQLDNENEAEIER